MTDGRWERSEFIWSCEGCGCVLTSSQAPPPEQAKCLGCRVDDEMGHAQRLVRDLVKERDEWMARARKAERALDEHCDEIFTLKARLSATEAAE